MNHFASPEFWEMFYLLPAEVQRQARAAYARLRYDPRHPGLHFKKVGPYWSARVGLNYRVLATEVEGGFLWGWIGSHADYDKLISD